MYVSHTPFSNNFDRMVQHLDICLIHIPYTFGLVVQAEITDDLTQVLVVIMSDSGVQTLRPTAR